MVVLNRSGSSNQVVAVGACGILLALLCDLLIDCPRLVMDGTGRMHYVEKATSALWRKNIATREALCRIGHGKFGIIQKVKEGKLQELHHVELK